MSQLSKTHLEGIIQKELFDLFYYIINSFDAVFKAQDFFNELLTKTERVMLVKRLAIALLLSKGYTYRNIRLVLRVSFPTIRSVQFWLDHGGAGYQKAITKLIQREETAGFLAKVDRILDKTSPTL